MDAPKFLGNLLRAGVVLAALVVLAGGIVYVSRHGQERPALGSFHGEAQDLRSLPGIVAASSHFGGRAIIQLGLVLLIATPVARVIGAAVVFARQHDWLYTAIASLVLALLLYSLMHAA
ncbi:MAG TPA: DUF1634 domain-containing protein [Candidatus Acidoferrales bacterium]|nr:DUF1634 domain-containing protein [Candidatus Acidoferrales bacterium]